MGEMRNAHNARILVEKPKGKRPLGRPRPRWENNIRMGIREMSVTQIVKKFPLPLWKHKVHYRVQNSPTLVPIPNQIHSVHTFPQNSTIQKQPAIGCSLP
jgi:hypothetical protein